MATTILLTRHGETDWNVHHIIQGWEDVPLNLKGVWQAQALARRVHAEYEINAFYSSDLQRAARTAQEVADLFDQDVNYLKDLREKGFGEIQGLTWPQVVERYPQMNGMREIEFYLHKFEGGESGYEVDQRMRAALDRILAEHQDQTVLVTAHGGCLRCALAHLLGESLEDFLDKSYQGEYEYRSKNTGLFVFSLEGDSVETLVWNDVSHLANL